MYDYIAPQKFLDASRFLKANNPLYAELMNMGWGSYIAIDEELLFEQNDEDMDTESEDDGCDNRSPNNVAVHVKSEPMECSSIHNDSGELYVN